MRKLTALRRPAPNRPSAKRQDIARPENLDREIAMPTLGGVRSIITETPTEGLDPGRLAAILRAAAQGDADAYLALAELIEEKYLHYQGVLATRKRAVTQLDITVEAAGDDERSQDDADLIRDWLDRDDLEDETFDILDAIGKGFSVTEMVWDRSKMPWLPKLKTRDPRWFQPDLVDGETLRLKGGPDGNSAMPTDLPPHRFIIHRSSGKTGITIRGGLARSVAWAFLFQNFALKDWVIFADVYGMPIRVGKYGPNATRDDKNALLRAVAGIATDAAAIIPQSMTIDFEGGTTAGDGAVFKDLAEYLDQQVSKVVVGQTATTDAVAGGLGSGQSNVHNDVRQDIQRADAKKLAATLNRDAVRSIIDLNHGPPPSGKYPRIKIGQAEKFDKDARENADWFIEHGGQVEESVMRDKIGLPDPEPDGDPNAPPRMMLPASVVAAQYAPQMPLQDGQGAPGGPSGARTAASALNAALTGLKSALKSDPAPNAPNIDAIDDLTDLAAAGWTEVMAPLIAPIEATLAASTSIEDFKSRLIGALQEMDASAMTDLLARSTFNAWLAGEAGLDLGGSHDATS